jgi:hypothetical protein
MTTKASHIVFRRLVGGFALFVATAGHCGLPGGVWGDEAEEIDSTQSAASDVVATPSVRSRPDVVLVVGAGGEAEFEAAFRSWAMGWKRVAQSAGATVTWIGAEPDDDVSDNDSPETNDAEQALAETPAEPSQIASSQGEASPDGQAPDEQALDEQADPTTPQTDRERLRQTLADLEPGGREPVWIVLMGHGTFGASIPKFNLRGPDLSADELAQWVLPITRPLVVVNASSSSGPFINALSGPGRVIVTATQSGQEQNYSRFGDYLARSIADPASDIDHDGEVSILEAFLAASAGVREFYRSSDRLPTETALIDDNGDGLGTPATAYRGTRGIVSAADSKKSLDGKMAAKLSLATVGQRLSFTDEELQQRDEIEADLERLHSRKSELAPGDYRQAVLPLLLRLAKIYDAAERRQAGD